MWRRKGNYAESVEIIMPPAFWTDREQWPAKQALSASLCSCRAALVYSSHDDGVEAAYCFTELEEWDDSRGVVCEGTERFDGIG